MLKTTRMAALAAVLFVAASSAVVPYAAEAQTPPPSAPAAPAATAQPAPPDPPPPPAPAAPAAKAGTRTTELVYNPYGLEALLKGSDIVARVTLAILAIMSMGS